jgi:hypothetical protein
MWISFKISNCYYSSLHALFFLQPPDVHMADIRVNLTDGKELGITT